MTSCERVRLALDYKPADRIATYDCYMLAFIGTHSIGADIPPAHYEYYMSIVRNTTTAGKRDAV